MTKITADEVDLELERLVDGMRIPSAHKRYFEMGFDTAVAFICRRMPDAECFCGCHNSKNLELDQ